MKLLSTPASPWRTPELEFVNGGGTGWLESTADDPTVTEVAAGSELSGIATSICE